MKRTFRPARSEKRSFSPIIWLSWFLILCWFGFLVYCWRTGILNSIKINSFGAKVAENELKSLRGKNEKVTSVIEEKSDVHIIFSTDCGAYQDWQSLLVFHSALAVGQKGPITRIASGCDEQKEASLTALYVKMGPKYNVHFTPDFKKDEKTGKSYDFYNKPYGLRHWLANANPPLDNDVVVALIDPDFIFLRPITTQVKGVESNLFSKPWLKDEVENWGKVSKGKPVAQTYGLGAPWVNDKHPKFGRKRICGADSPCLDIPTEREGGKYYSVGPPYLVQKEDLVKLAESWCNFVPKVYEKYPYLLAEMYAYSMAAAHESLPHLRLDNFMVSNTDMSDEGYAWIDALDDPCSPPVDGIYFPGKPLPTFLHHCQLYRVGEWAYGKRRVNKEIFSCDKPMLAELPPDLISLDYQIKNGKKVAMSTKQIKRNAFMICTAYRSLNAALLDYKTRNCGPEANFDKITNVGV